MSGKLFAAAIAAIAAGTLIAAPVNAAQPAQAQKAPNAASASKASNATELSVAIRGAETSQGGDACSQYAPGLLKAACATAKNDDNVAGGHCNSNGRGHEIGKGKGHDKDDDCPVSS